MGIVVSWLDGNWFSLLQTLGIVGGLLFNAYTLMLNSRIRKVDTLINITQQHRAIWLKYLDSPGLKRVLDPKPLPAKHPITDEELMFVNLVILHLTSVLTAIRWGVLTKQAGLDTDINDFFNLPIPHAAWERMKRFCDKETVDYVESCLRRQRN